MQYFPVKNDSIEYINSELSSLQLCIAFSGKASHQTKEEISTIDLIIVVIFKELH